MKSLKRALIGLILITLTNNVLAKTSEIECLAQTIYHEARGEGDLGMQAVAIVTINRAKSDIFPSTICAVVNQPYQYSWVKDKSLKISNQESYGDSLRIAARLYHDYFRNNRLSGNLRVLRTALYFNSLGRAGPKLRHIATIGNHYFYTRRV